MSPEHFYESFFIGINRQLHKRLNLAWKEISHSKSNNLRVQFINQEVGYATEELEHTI